MLTLVQFHNLIIAELFIVAIYCIICVCVLFECIIFLINKAYVTQFDKMYCRVGVFYLEFNIGSQILVCVTEYNTNKLVLKKCNQLICDYTLCD